MLSYFWPAEQTGKWETLTPLKAKYPIWNPLCIGQSIWVSSRCDDGEKGMIEFCCSSNTVKQVISYPDDFNPVNHSICGLEGNDIMIIDGHTGKMRTFNVINKKYGPEITIPELGSFVSSIMIRGYLHIMHGYNDANSKYLVYSVADGTLSEFKGNHQSPKTYHVAITKGPDDTFYKFGGRDYINENKELDAFYVGKLQYDDPSKPIQWKKTDHWTLKSLRAAVGYIMFDHRILIFGGYTLADTMGYDDIYILDVRSKKGWIQSPIKCSVKSPYVAVLDHRQRVHLFSFGIKNNHHYCIALNELIPDLAIYPMKQSVTMKKPKRIQQHDDEKGNDETTDTAKLRVCSMVKLNAFKLPLTFRLVSCVINNNQNINRVLKATNESLQDEVERLGTANGALRAEMEMDKKKAVERIEALESGHNELVMRLNVENKEMKDRNAVQQNEVESLKIENEALKEKERESRTEVLALKKTNTEIKELHEVEVEEMKEQMVVKEEEQRLLVEDMMAENKRLSDQVAVHEEEQKEAQIKIAELEDKVKELELKALDPSKFMEWDWNLIHLWIMGLEGGRFQKYDVVMKDTLTRDEVMGEDLLSVNPLVLKAWGIRDRKDSKSLNQYIQELVAQNQSKHEQRAIAAPKQNEGLPTAYM